MNSLSLYKTPEGEREVMAIYTAALKNWSAPSTTQMVSTRHGDAFVIASGAATSPALILLHGAGSNSAIWAGEAAAYSGTFRVYAVDLPGEPGRSAPNRPPWDGPAFADWLADVLNGLGVERATLVGISQGAWVALKFAVAQPERVDRLVLLTPGGIVPDRTSFLFRAIGLSLLGTWGLKRLTADLFGDQAVPAGVIEIVVEISRHFKPRLGVLPLFTDDELKRLTMPLLLVGGTKDIMRDLEKIEARLRQHVPDLAVKWLPGAGHALINTQPAVLEFLMTSAVREEPV